MEYDEVLETIGEFSRLQQCLFHLGGVVNALSAMATLSSVFLIATPDHWCSVPEIDSFNLTTNITKVLTLPVEEDEGLTHYRYGRRRSLLSILALHAVTMFLLAISVNFPMYLAFRFLEGAAEMAGYTITFVLVLELVGRPWRGFVGVGSQYYWSLGYVLTAAYGFFLRRWRHLQLLMAAHVVFYIPLAILCVESPRWLYSVGRVQEAEEVVKKMAKFNKREKPAHLNVIIESSPSQAYIWHIWRYPKLRTHALIMFSIWFVCSLGYYALSLNTSNLGGNDYTTFLILGAIEFPSYLCAHQCVNRLGRRLSMIISMATAGFALLFTIAVPDDQKYTWLIIAMSTIGKFGISAAFAIVFIYTAELFPTELRTSGVSFGSFCARIGGIIAPQILLLRSYSIVIPVALCGGLCLLSALSGILLPETLKATLAETMSAAERSREKETQIYKAPVTATNGEAEIMM